MLLFLVGHLWGVLDSVWDFLGMGIMDVWHSFWMSCVINLPKLVGHCLDDPDSLLLSFVLLWFPWGESRALAPLPHDAFASQLNVLCRQRWHAPSGKHIHRCDAQTEWTRGQIFLEISISVFFHRTGGNGRHYHSKTSQRQGAGYEELGTTCLSMFGASPLTWLFLMSALLRTKCISSLFQTRRNCVLGDFQKHLEDLWSEHKVSWKSVGLLFLNLSTGF